MSLPLPPTYLAGRSARPPRRVLVLLFWPLIGRTVGN
jgi:hypothetical protein